MVTPFLEVGLLSQNTVQVSTIPKLIVGQSPRLRQYEPGVDFGGGRSAFPSRGSPECPGFCAALLGLTVGERLLAWVQEPFTWRPSFSLSIPDLYFILLGENGRDISASFPLTVPTLSHTFL